MDNELFELCEKVSVIFPLQNTSDLLWLIKGEHAEVSVIYSPAVHWPTAPLYTSDYLLEKLPKWLKSGASFGLAPVSSAYTESRAEWKVGYYKASRSGEVFAVSATPLKALLKLVLALKEAGEL